ncbi:YheC/YheD family protein [Cohnella silvisoli]|uniref:YheC/YheD family protein n=1 Tax=Cohnella silvisoli TaxID=2873699 RepID=A0ABV1KRS9_9BACL|nr:YheC/YheD family protein [Cohnella silvisoli]MCD9022516.1 YheC/YheD family protein [Cohnella silvisoli]
MNKQTAVSSKWIKTRVMEGSAFLAAHIPTTRLLNRRTLSELLNRYGMVYVKPVKGSLGVGVMRIDQSTGSWVIQSGMNRTSFSTFEKAYQGLRKRINGKAYLVQRGIHMLRYKMKPLDFRVMVQKGNRVGWEVTGIAARVAHPGKAVTNGSQGGSIYAAKMLLRRTSGNAQAAKLSRLFKRLGLSTAKRLGATYPGMRELGLDIAVDGEHRAWILEVNTKPDPCPFTKLDDPAMLRKIVRYAKGYGRSYNLRCGKAKSGGIITHEISLFSRNHRASVTYYRSYLDIRRKT